MTETHNEELIVETKELAAQKIVNSYVGWTASAGFIPIPFADLAGISLVQLKMISSLSNLYTIPFNRNAAKSVIAALVGGAVPFTVAGPVASLIKAVPGLGSLVGALTLPTLAGASTYALGKVFIQHFESGGTFLDLDPEKVSAYFKSQFESKHET